jgi:DNA topoisomerase-2
MLLVNGARGIGTGYSTFVPQYNPADLKRMILEWLETGSGLDRALAPWVKGFKGGVQKEDDKSYILSGVLKDEKDGVTITELPPGTWTADVRETLDKMVVDGTVKDYTDMSTDMVVNIKVKCTDRKVLDKVLKDKWKLTNMHAFDSKGVIRRYESPHEILNEFVHVRLALYGKRRDAMLKALRDKLPYHENVVRFIRQQCEATPRPELRRKTQEECDVLLANETFVKLKGSYDYLMNLPIASLTLTHAKKQEAELADLKRRIGDLEKLSANQMWVNELNALNV